MGYRLGDDVGDTFTDLLLFDDGDGDFSRHKTPSTPHVRRADGTTEIVGNKQDDIYVEAGNELDFITWGGGGWGDPLDRDVAIIEREIALGLVTAEGARVYGVMIAADGGVDVSGTATFPAQIKDPLSRTLPTFDYGMPIYDLGARSLQDTGLDGPKRPVWRTRRSTGAELAVAAE